MEIDNIRCLPEFRRHPPNHDHFTSALVQFLRFLPEGMEVDVVRADNRTGQEENNDHNDPQQAMQSIHVSLLLTLHPKLPETVFTLSMSVDVYARRNSM